MYLNLIRIILYAFKFYFKSFVCVMIFALYANAQTIGKPDIMLSSSGGLRAICKGNFAVVKVSYTVWTAFPNNYSIKVSDKSGDFTTTIDADILSKKDDPLTKEVEITFNLSKITTGGVGYKLRVSSSGVTSPDSPSFIVIVPEDINVVANRQVICEGEDFTLTARSVSGNPLKGTFTWMKMPSLTVVGRTNPITLTEAGTYSVVFIGSTCPISAQIKIDKIEMKEKIDSDKPIKECSFTSVQLFVKDKNPLYTYSYQWYKDGAILTGETSERINVSPSNHGNGTYFVKLSLTYMGKTCTKDLPNTKIKLKPEKPKINPSKKLPVCQTNTNINNLTLTATNVSKGASLQWLKDNIAITGAVSNTYKPKKEGAYKVVASIGSCSDTSDKVDVTVIKINPFSIKAESYSECGNETVKLVNNTTQSDVKYTWYKDGKEIPGKNSTSLDIDAVNNVNGVYKLRVQSTIDNSCELYSNDITLKIKPRVNISTGKTVLPLCNKGKVKLTASANSPSGANLSYKWFKNNVVITDKSGNPINSKTLEAQVDDSKIDNYKVEVFDGVCKSESNQISLSVLSSKNYKIILPNDYSDCSKNNVIISTNTNLPTAAFRYEWYLNNAVIKNHGKNNFVVKRTSKINGNGEYKLKIYHRLENCFIETNKVSVKLKPNIPKIAGGQNILICKGSSLDLNIEKNNSYAFYNKFTWFKDKKQISSDKQLKAAREGTYQVEACEDNCCVKSDETKVKEVDKDDFKISVSKTTICKGESLKVNAPYSDISNVKYSWYKNDKPFLSKSNDISISSQGVYYAKVTLNGCEIITNKLNIKINEIKGAGVDKEKAFIETNSSASFNAYGGDEASWYEKQIDGSFKLVHKGYQFKTPILNSNKSYRLKIKSNDIPCEYIRDIYVEVSSNHQYDKIISNMITPDGDGKNDKWVIPDAFAFKKDVRVIIFDRQGNIVLDQNEYKNDWQGDLQGHDLPGGTYFYIIKLKNKEVKGFITLFK